ncbi:MAG TPA: STAS domain-containing protein [Tepidisphaeraceae bacterium]|nr:STAS domain-containing protein [Tepidisphaeraceae bacterium]
MSTSAIPLKMTPEHLVELLRGEALEQVRRGQPGAVLDFSGVTRIDAGAIKGLEDLARLAEESNVPLQLRGVGIEVYRVLKLLKLAEKLSFA